MEYLRAAKSCYKANAAPPALWLTAVLAGLQVRFLALHSVGDGSLQLTALYDCVVEFFRCCSIGVEVLYGMCLKNDSCYLHSLLSTAANDIFINHSGIMPTQKVMVKGCTH